MTFPDFTKWFSGRGRSAVAEKPQVEDVTRDGVIAVIDRLARQRTGLSANQLLCAYRAGRLSVKADVSDLLAYSDLLSPSDPIFLERAAAPDSPRYAVR